MVGDEESARDMCRDIEDRSSCGITAETLNEVEKEYQTTKGRNNTHLIGWVSDVLGSGSSPYSHADGISGVSMADCSSCCRLGDAWTKVTGCDGCECDGGVNPGVAASRCDFWSSGSHSHQASVFA